MNPIVRSPDRLRPPMRVRKQSVRRKLMAVIVRTTAIALCLAAVAMSVVDMTTYRNARASQLSTEASILALATAPALAFDDPSAAERSLGALRAHAAVLAAALYTPDGSLYASYVKLGQPAPPARLSSFSNSMGVRRCVLLSASPRMASRSARFI